MANSTTKSKAKTKTPKKPAAQAAAKSTKTVSKATEKAAKTAVPAQAKAAVKDTKVTKPARVPRNRTVTSRVINKWHRISALLFVVAAIAAVLLSNPTSAQVFLGHLTANELASKSTTVFAPAARVLFDVELRWVLAALLGLSAVASILRATRHKAAEAHGIAERILTWRWLDAAITGAVAIALAGLLSGVQDAAALKGLMFITAIAAVFGWIAEREGAGAGRLVRASYIASAVCGLVVVLSLATTVAAATIYGDVRLPWYVYAFDALVAVSFALAGWNLLRSQTRAIADYLKVEYNYVRLNLLAKIAAAAILIIGIHK